MRRLVLTTLLIWLLPVLPAAADIYRSVDAQGQVHYSDTPSPGAQLISSSASPDMRASDDSASNADAAKPTPLLQRGEQISRQLAQQAAARAVARDTADAHGKQCQQAQQAYQQTIEARRLYKVSPDGERQYLTDDEADQQRVNNRLAMQSACEGMSAPPAAGNENAASGTSSSASGGNDNAAGSSDSTATNQ